MLTTQLPRAGATAGQAEQRRDKQAAAIRRKLAQYRHRRGRPHHRTGKPPPTRPDPAAQALRQQIRAPLTGLPGQRTTLDTELAALQEPPTEQASDPSLLDELPFLGDILTSAPADLTERLLDACDVQAVYNRDKNQVTIHATLTDATPQAIKDLLTDPRADHNTPLPSQPGTTPQGHVGHLTGHTGRPPGLAQGVSDDRHGRSHRPSNPGPSGRVTGRCTVSTAARSGGYGEAFIPASEPGPRAPASAGARRHRGAGAKRTGGSGGRATPNGKQPTQADAW